MKFFSSKSLTTSWKPLSRTKTSFVLKNLHKPFESLMMVFMISASFWFAGYGPSMSPTYPSVVQIVKGLQRATFFCPKTIFCDSHYLYFFITRIRTIINQKQIILNIKQCFCNIRCVVLNKIIHVNRIHAKTKWQDVFFERLNYTVPVRIVGPPVFR